MHRKQNHLQNIIYAILLKTLSYLVENMIVYALLLYIFPQCELAVSVAVLYLYRKNVYLMQVYKLSCKV